MLNCSPFIYATLYFLSLNVFCNGQIVKTNRDSYETISPLPFPTCKVDNIECLRRGFRTFFFLMESGHLGMSSVDPIVLNSVAIGLPEHQVSFLLRRVNVTGAKWTKLADRRVNLRNGNSGVIFNSDLHVGAEIYMTTSEKVQPSVSYITMDIQDVESNVSYSWRGERSNNDDYILIGPERIAVRNRLTPSYFLQPKNMDSRAIDSALQLKPSVLDYFTNEIVTALMHTVIDNFRLFASKVPVKYYYQYN